MTKKDFEVIADILRELIGPVSGGVQDRVVDHFVKELSRRNPHFKEEKFRARCSISFKG